MSELQKEPLIKKHIFYTVMGVAGLCGTILVALKMLQDEYEDVRCGFSVLIGCFLFGWLIYGSVLVFGMEIPSQDHKNYCQFSAHLFAFLSIIFRKSTTTYIELLYLKFGHLICQNILIGVLSLRITDTYVQLGQSCGKRGHVQLL